MQQGKRHGEISAILPSSLFYFLFVLFRRLYFTLSFSPLGSFFLFSSFLFFSFILSSFFFFLISPRSRVLSKTKSYENCRFLRLYRGE